MANEKNKINELVPDDEDPTAELEVAAFREEIDFAADVEAESDAHTFGLADQAEDSAHREHSISELRSDLDNRTKTIGRLQYDIEQLRSRWIGLETEIKAREEIVGTLSRDIDDLRDTVSRKEKLIKKRDLTIRSLKAEIRQRDESHRSLVEQHAEIQALLEAQRESENATAEALETAEKEIGTLRSHLDKEDSPVAPAIVVEQRDELALAELHAQHEKTEAYADSLRLQLKDLNESHEDACRDRDHFARSLEQKTEHIQELSADFADAKETIANLRINLDEREQSHQDELRVLRFELGEAENTVTEATDLNSQLTSDLVDTRGYKEELERMLCNNDEKSQERIGELEKELRKLSQSATDFQQKLESKSAAINVLLNELSKKTEQIESIGEIEEVIHDIDDRMSEQFDAPVEYGLSEAATRPVQSERDKVTRVLIGSIGEQVLRFPLFKDRLTIGRTEDNDIQLKLSYISRRHAVVLTEGDATRVIDWGSKNGVYVNGKRVKEHFLSNGDIVAVGDAKFRYEERRKRDS